MADLNHAVLDDLKQVEKSITALYLARTEDRPRLSKECEDLITNLVSKAQLLTCLAREGLSLEQYIEETQQELEEAIQENRELKDEIFWLKRANREAVWGPSSWSILGLLLGISFGVVVTQF